MSGRVMMIIGRSEEGQTNGRKTKRPVISHGPEDSWARCQISVARTSPSTARRPVAVAKKVRKKGWAWRHACTIREGHAARKVVLTTARDTPAGSPMTLRAANAQWAH